MRMKKGMEAVVFLYEAFNLWSCMFVSSIEWSNLAPTDVFLYGSAKSLDIYRGLGERAGFYAVLSLFLVAAVCMLTKDATVGPRAMQVCICIYLSIYLFVVCQAVHFSSDMCLKTLFHYTKNTST